MAVGVPQGEAQRGVAAGPLYAWGIARSMRGARSTAIMRCTTCAPITDPCQEWDCWRAAVCMPHDEQHDCKPSTGSLLQRHIEPLNKSTDVIVVSSGTRADDLGGAGHSIGIATLMHLRVWNTHFALRC